MDSRERKNERIGWLTTVGIHGVMAVILMFVIAWRAPDPPLPEYGIELNFGLDDQGSGEVQPQEAAGDQGESVTETNAAEPQPTDSEESKVEPDKAVDKTSEPVASKLESPVSVKEEKKAAETIKTPDKTISEPKKEAVASKTDQVQKTPTDDAKKGEDASHGDDTKKPGDKGSEEGKIDANSLYGTPGGGGGGNGLGLTMGGWDWADKPVIPDLPDTENGKIVFEIVCDENGDITGITTVERTLSPQSELLLKEMIRKNSLIPNGKTKPVSKGYVSFVLRTK